MLAKALRTLERVKGIEPSSSAPEDFDLEVLREAWARWREASEVIA
jgi:hypothetical protein